jgi:hypothetical protein
MSLNIFMLDKNIVSLIQSKNDGKTKTKDQIEMLQLLKRHDKSIYRFSSLSSAIEGRKKQKESKIESINTVDYETQILKSFFKKAKTDAHILKSNESNFSEVFSQYNVLHNQEKYKSVLKKYYELREKYVEKGSIPLNKKEAFSFELLEYIEAQDIAKENPIISIIFLAINQIIDNKYIDNPCNVLKLKKGKSLDENIHNIYSDLSIPNLISRLEFEGKGDIKITFLTLDKALSSYMEIFKFNYISEIKKNTGYLKLHQVEVEIQSKLIRSFFKNFFENWEASKNNSHSISSTKPSNKTE